MSDCPIMHITLKLMGMLKSKTPEGGRLAISDGAVIADVLQTLEVDPQSVQVFTVNGKLIRDRNHPLSDGDELSILPPVGGG